MKDRLVLCWIGWTIRQMGAGQRVVALCVLLVIGLTPLACIIHCWLVGQYASPTASIAGQPLAICHQPGAAPAPQPLDPTLLQRLSQWTQRDVQSALSPLPLTTVLLFPFPQLHTQISIAPPTPPPRRSAS